MAKIFTKKNLIIFLIIIIGGSLLFYFSRDTRTPEEKDIEAMKKGWMDMIGGQIAEIDSQGKTFILDIDPYGKHEKYKIYTDKNTGFSIFTRIATINPNIVGVPPEESTTVETKTVPASFESLQKDMQVSVYFDERIDFRKAWRLKATKVVILEDEVKRLPELPPYNE